MFYKSELIFGLLIFFGKELIELKFLEMKLLMKR